MTPEWQLHEGDVVEVLPELDERSIDCIVTSPPYLWMRDYGVEPSHWPEVEYVPMIGLPPVRVPAWTGCLGLETEPLAFVGHLVHLGRQLFRVLADDGTFWLNLGDTFSQKGSGGSSGGLYRRRRAARDDARQYKGRGGVPTKNLMCIPERVALALQADGWLLRQRVVWHKATAMPEPVVDRPQSNTETVLLFAKSPTYHYDRTAVVQPLSPRTRASTERAHPDKPDKIAEYDDETLTVDRFEQPSPSSRRREGGVALGQIWTLRSQPRRGESHHAAFPDLLPETCIRLGCKPAGRVLDPFAGRGTTGTVALRLGRSVVLVERNGEFVELARANLRGVAPLFHREIA